MKTNFTNGFHGKYTMDALREESRVLHPEVLAVERKSIQEDLKNPRVTLPYYTK